MPDRDWTTYQGGREKRLQHLEKHESQGCIQKMDLGGSRGGGHTPNFQDLGGGGS